MPVITTVMTGLALAKGIKAATKKPAHNQQPARIHTQPTAVIRANKKSDNLQNIVLVGGCILLTYLIIKNLK